MAERVFVDTNVLIYADDDDSPDKRDRCRALLRSLIADGRAVVSTQVLQEYFVVATRKLGLGAEAARARVEALSRLDVVLIRPELVLSAIDLHRLHSISLWDALVVRCAAAARCAVLATEDLQHGRVLEGVRIESPFADP